MAYGYWDGWNDSSTSTGTTTNGWTTDAGTTTGGTGNYYYIPMIVRRLLVPVPDHWSDEDTDAFVRLVNIETKTGWQVEMIIKGDILITDPDIEVREMKDFMPLFKQRAGRGDREKIIKFFEEHPASVSLAQ